MSKLGFEKYSPLEASTNGIKTVIVDPHNQVFPSWYHFGRQKAAAVVHIDAHDDMFAASPPLDERIGNFDGVIEYAVRCISIASFIAPGIHHGFIGPVYHIDPRKKEICAYGRVKNQRFVSLPATTVENGLIRWVNPDSKRNEYRPPKAETMTLPQMVEDLRGYSGPLIIDIDLDALYSMDIDEPDKTMNLKIRKGLAMERLAVIIEAVQQIPHPGLITIARSAEDNLFTPPKLADFFQAQLLVELLKILKCR